jgi:hypothetical protein
LKTVFSKKRKKGIAGTSVIASTSVIVNKVPIVAEVTNQRAQLLASNSEESSSYANLAEDQIIQLTKQLTMAEEKNMQVALALRNLNEGRLAENLQVELMMEILEYDNNFA